MDAELVISAVKPEQFPADTLPEIAFLGRSNVGKSSLLNCFSREVEKIGFHERYAGPYPIDQFLPSRRAVSVRGLTGLRLR